jgi:hypothetical protein
MELLPNCVGIARRVNYSLPAYPVFGEMAEWLKAHDWKSCLPKGNVGSNPTLSAFDDRANFTERHRRVLKRGGERLGK